MLPAGIQEGRRIPLDHGLKPAGVTVRGFVENLCNRVPTSRIPYPASRIRIPIQHQDRPLGHPIASPWFSNGIAHQSDLFMKSYIMDANDVCTCCNAQAMRYRGPDLAIRDRTIEHGADEFLP